MSVIGPGGTIGMLGGGQLGRMSTSVAKQLGYKVITLDPTPDCPCGQIADEQIVANYACHKALVELGQKCDVITYEFENVPVESVETLMGLEKPVFPNGDVLRITQNRLKEKTFIRQAGLNVVDFLPVTTQAEFHTAVDQVGFPAILKTISGGYDGKGQFVLENPDEAAQALVWVKGRMLIWEKQVSFVKELGVICARNLDGQVMTYPPSENIHVNNILDCSIAPARVSAQVQQEAQRLARVIAAEMGLVGVCGIELFLLPDQTLLVNEIAPRPHNSGHYTIEACNCSQFEQHIRAVCGLPLGSTTLISGAVMVNILGTGGGNRLSGVPDVLQDERVHFHLYGKAEARANRKMGHLTVLADDVEEALAVALTARQKLKWV